jgi:hypothetical protein
MCSNLGMCTEEAHGAKARVHSYWNAVGDCQEPMGLSAEAAYSGRLGLVDQHGVGDEGSNHLVGSSSWRG